jgi:hypothetical protein
LSPKLASLRASRSAPDFVRMNTSTGPLARRRNFASHSVFSDAFTFSIVCVMLFAGAPVRADLHVLGVAHDLVGQLHHLFRHRGREEQRLARGRVRQRLHDPADVGPEAHVHHPVGLVEHQRVELVELPPRRCACGP